MCKREPYYTEQYRGYTIEVHQDDNAMNPYKETDGMYPMMTKGGHNVPKHDYKDASSAFFPGTSMYRRHKKKLLEAAGIDEDFERKDSIRPLSVNDIENMLDECIRGAVQTHNYDMLEAIGNILGVPCVQEHLTGYSQSDWMDVLVVCTPKFMKESGVTKKQALADNCKDMTLNAQIYGAWAYGDVFGFVIKDAAGKEIDDGSCWGFIEPETYPFEKTYVVAEARSSVDAEIEWRKKQHIKQLKTWIRNHVPLSHRQPLSL